jgi:hypothetical protein
MLTERTWQPEQQQELVQRQWEEWQQRFCASVGMGMDVTWTPDKVGGASALVLSQEGVSLAGDRAYAHTLHLTGKRMPALHAMPSACVGHAFESRQMQCSAYPVQQHMRASMRMAFWCIQPMDDFPRWFFQGGLFFAYRDDAIEKYVQQLWLEQAVPPSLKRQWRQQAMPYFVQPNNGLPMPGFGLYPACFQEVDFIDAITSMSEWYDFFITALMEVQAWRVSETLSEEDLKHWDDFHRMHEDGAVQAQSMALPEPWLRV